MSISRRERFLGICRFERPGDLFTSDSFWPETLEGWLKQGAPKEIVPKALSFHELFSAGSPFLGDYFQFDRWRSLTEVISGIGSAMANQPSGLGYGITRWQRTPVVPSYEPRIISEDERTVTCANGDGQTLRIYKDSVTRMPMYLDWPVKDRASWNEYKKRLDPNTLERWPADWNVYTQGMNKLGAETPIALEVGGFYGYLREWVGSERILYMFYDDPGLIENMMEQVLYLETEVIKRTLKDIKVHQATFWEDMC